MYYNVIDPMRNKKLRIWSGESFHRGYNPSSFKLHLVGDDNRCDWGESLQGVPDEERREGFGGDEDEDDGSRG
jgi:hypothetical protein